MDKKMGSGEPSQQPAANDLPADQRKETLPMEAYLASYGLEKLDTLRSGISLNLRYTTADNFMGEVLYEGLHNCYLQKEVVAMMYRAQHELQSIMPSYSLQVLDATRPLRVQQRMFNYVRERGQEDYISDPEDASLHNFGCAVDVTIIDSAGKELDMGTPYDYFGELAQPRYHKKFLESGHLSKEQYENRLLLRQVMMDAGFEPILTEWWHFNACTRDYARETYLIVD